MSTTDPSSAGTLQNGVPAVIPKPRDRSIDTLRGFAILVLIAFHSIAVPMMQIKGFRVLHHIIDPFIMPLFAMLSGYVYAIRPVTREKLRAFVRAKIVRLLMPMAIAAIIMLGLQSIESREPWRWRSLYSALFYSYEHFWFLQALFIVFLMMAAIDLLKWMNRPVFWFAWIYFAIVLRAILDPMLDWLPLLRDFFSLWAVPYLFLPFVVGVGITRFAGNLKLKRLNISLILFLVVMSLLYAFAIEHPETHQKTGRMSLIAMSIGIAGSFLLIRLRLDARLMARLGDLSYPIYLYHAIGIAIGMRIIDHFKIHSAIGQYGLRYSAGLFAPLLLISLLSIWPIAYEVVTGEILKRKSKSVS